jgi:tRNA threonylcarbamoyladenosine biosynthesis protein TsaB
MPSYIAIQNTYDIFEMALFLNDICVDHIQEDKRHTSKLFIPLLEKLLFQNSTKIADLDFCAVNCGPGPFSALRSIIASVNGLHAAINIPLIGVDGLEATFLEYYDPNYQHTVVLLNAFNQEVYYLIAHKGQITAKGYQKIDALLNRAHSDLSDEALAKSEPVEELSAKIHFIGNGVTLYHHLIKEKIGINAIIKKDSPEMCSVQMIGALGAEKWKHYQENTYVMPLYLKKHAVEL